MVPISANFDYYICSNICSTFSWLAKIQVLDWGEIRCVSWLGVCLLFIFLPFISMTKRSGINLYLSAQWPFIWIIEKLHRAKTPLAKTPIIFNESNMGDTPDIASYHLHIYSLYQDTEDRTQNDNYHTRY